MVQGFLIGIISVSLFNTLHRYGIKAVIFKPSDLLVRQVFSMIEQGDLTGLKALTKDVPPKNLVEMNLHGQQSVLIYAVEKERRDIVRWLIEEKGADVNKLYKNETALQRAIFRNNELIVRDLLSFGANMEQRIPDLDFTMPVYAIVRENHRLLDIMLEMGGSSDYVVNGKPVDLAFKNRSQRIAEVHLKHDRWRRLRKWLKLEEQVGMGISRAESKI